MQTIAEIRRLVQRAWWRALWTIALAATRVWLDSDSNHQFRV
jgi:hypothetical protein